MTATTLAAVKFKSLKRKADGAGKKSSGALSELLQLLFTLAVVGLAVVLATTFMRGGVDGVRQVVVNAIGWVTEEAHDLLGTPTDPFGVGSGESGTAGSVASGTGDASDDPSQLTVTDPASMTGYTRAQFGQAWTDDVDVEDGHNGCETRDDILARDMTGVTLSGTCKVMSGTLADPYTASVLSFVRGPETSSLVQIDHLVPLANVWISGAQSWDPAERKQIANDPMNLLAVDGSTNEAKSSYAADQWVPPNTAFDCIYVKKQVMVKNKYHLTVTAAEKQVMQAYYGRC